MEPGIGVEPAAVVELEPVDELVLVVWVSPEEGSHPGIGPSFLGTDLGWLVC